jgi:hypothetical protein
VVHGVPLGSVCAFELREQLRVVVTGLNIATVRAATALSNVLCMYFMLPLCAGCTL